MIQNVRGKHYLYRYLQIVLSGRHTNAYLPYHRPPYPTSIKNRSLANTTQTHHAQNRYRLRLHRARSVILTPSELVEIRAAQRTFEGAYIRTSLGQFSFALVVLKIFTSEFYSIGKPIRLSIYHFTFTCTRN